ncbi:MAG: hypothetical protein V3S89_04935 [Desulfobacterales bacterium]
MLITIGGILILIAGVTARAVYLIKTNQMPDLDEMVPRDPRLGRF